MNLYSISIYACRRGRSLTHVNQNGGPFLTGKNAVYSTKFIYVQNMKRTVIE